MPKVIEHLIYEFIKVIFICDNGDSAEALGDLPALPYCFTSSECVRIDKTEVCWSEWLKIKDFLVRVESSTVSGLPTSISFHARGVKCSDDPKKVYDLISEYLNDVCVKRT
ncbi:MAG: hypothetical protein QXP80_00265 [Zestosphaera sp.]